MPRPALVAPSDAPPPALPAQQAATALNVGVTTLKKVCRVNAIGRWPFRKRSSLNRLIEKTREYFASGARPLAGRLSGGRLVGWLVK